MKNCLKCGESREEKDFYGKRAVCKYCHREYVYSKRSYERKSDKSDSEGIKEVIKTNPDNMMVNNELYNYLLKL